MKLPEFFKLTANMLEPDLVLTDRRENSEYVLKLVRNGIPVTGSGPGYLDTYYRLLKELEELEAG